MNMNMNMMTYHRGVFSEKVTALRLSDSHAYMYGFTVQPGHYHTAPY